MGDVFLLEAWLGLNPLRITLDPGGIMNALCRSLALYLFSGSMLLCAAHADEPHSVTRKSVQVPRDPLADYDQGRALSKPGPLYPAPAADLVRKVTDDEGKIEQLRSLYLKLIGQWTHTPKGIADAKAKLAKQFPGQSITPSRFESLRPIVTEELEYAFDERRVRKHAFRHDVRIDTRVWNGARAVIYEKYLTHPQEYYSLDIRPERFVTANLFLDLAWQRMGPSRLRWTKEDASPELTAPRFGRPEDFQIVGEQEYRGRRCHVVENRLVRRRCWIDVEEGRLRGIAYLFTPPPKDPLAWTKRIYGRDFASLDEAEAWFQSLAKEDQQPLLAQMIDLAFERSRPMSEFFLDDYRALAPGVWFPARQGYRSFDIDVADAEPSEVLGERVFELVEARVNDPLPDSLFEIELADGIQVNDWGHDPPLFYKQKKDRTPDEWHEIVTQHQRRNAEWRKEQEARDALVGKPAFEFPTTKWLNSDPLDWEKLRGKVVLLHFWAHWCGPCHADLPLLSARFKRQPTSDLVIIGVHNPGSEQEEIEKDIKDHELGYPIVIDAPRPHQPRTWGLLSHEYGIRGIPHAVVIDRDGRIAANGQLTDALAKAHELASVKRE